MKDRLSPATLRDLLKYDETSGRLFWKRRPLEFFKTAREHKRWNGRYAGKRAFSLNSEGYEDGYILRNNGGGMHRAHQVAWAIAYGAWPSGPIDHINGDRADNRLCNLRCVSPQENARNAKKKSTNKSGVIGVSACKDRWRATIMADGRQISLGVFDSISAAAVARKEAEKRFGYHPNHGRPHQKQRGDGAERAR